MHLIRCFAAAGLALTLAAQAQTADPAAHSTAAASAAAPMVDGEVRKIDRAQAKLTLRHGPIANLEMPAMTMVFKVADPKWLDHFHEGDKVRFSAAKVDGAITVTAIEPARQARP